MRNSHETSFEHALVGLCLLELLEKIQADALVQRGGSVILIVFHQSGFRAVCLTIIASLDSQSEEAKDSTGHCHL